jgi:hypothetical protein
MKPLARKQNASLDQFLVVIAHGGQQLLARHLAGLRRLAPLDDEMTFMRMSPSVRCSAPTPATPRKLCLLFEDARPMAFPTPESRRPILALPRELPIMGEPQDVWRIVVAAREALAAPPYPKLLLFGKPGALVTPAFAESFAATLKGCRVNLGPGLHCLQKDRPSAIGHAISGWIARIETAGRGELRAA